MRRRKHRAGQAFTLWVIEIEDALWEFKNRSGARLLYFYEPGQNTILTNGLKKGEDLKAAIRRANNLRAQLRESDE